MINAVDPSESLASAKTSVLVAFVIIETRLSRYSAASAHSDRGKGMLRKILGGALVAIVVVIGLIALAIPYYWAYWIWSLDWGTFLVNRRWIFGFLGFTLG